MGDKLLFQRFNIREKSFRTLRDTEVARAHALGY